MDIMTETADHPAVEPSEGVAEILAGAVDRARQAVIEFSGETVGAYLGMTVEDGAAGTHRFLSTTPGYQGWQWAVVVAAYPGADHATISEVVLVPGPTALLAPAWIPWEQRVKPGDLGPGDLLAPLPDDPRLVPGYLATGDPLIDDTAVEVGFGRRRVLSALGRDEAARRWHDGENGPDAAMARSTKRVCRDCGFMVPLAGALGAMFGVCCNEMSADGRVVDFFYGCGAHSDTPAPAGSGSALYEPYDDGVLEVIEASIVVEVVSDLGSAGESDVDAGESEIDAVAADTDIEPGRPEIGTEAELVPAADDTEPVPAADDTETEPVQPAAEAESAAPVVEDQPDGQTGLF